VRVNLIHSILVFGEKNIVHIIVRVNLIHFKLVFFLKKNVKKFNTLKRKRKEKKTVNSANTVQVNWTVHCEQCNSLALFSEQCN
jgi:hypothetical protein